MCNENNSSLNKENNKQTEKDVFLESPYWVAQGTVDSDASINYCSKCIDKAVEEQKGHKDGGWPTEHDTPPYCDTCNTPLAGSILDDNNTVIETLAEWQVYP